MGRRLLRVFGGFALGFALLVASAGCVQVLLSEALEYGHSPTLAQEVVAVALPLSAEFAGWIWLRRVGRRDQAIGIMMFTAIGVVGCLGIFLLRFAVPFH